MIYSNIIFILNHFKPYLMFRLCHIRLERRQSYTAAAHQSLTGGAYHIAAYRTNIKTAFKHICTAVGIDYLLTRYKLNDRNINYCKFCVSVEALRQLGLITVSCSDSRIAKVKVTQKADLDSAPVLVSLRSRTQTAKIKE